MLASVAELAGLMGAGARPDVNAAEVPRESSLEEEPSRAVAPALPAAAARFEHTDDEHFASINGHAASNGYRTIHLHNRRPGETLATTGDV
jgi:hypothetical protein